MNMAVKHPNDGPIEEEPSNKKMRNEDSLIPEEVFLARNPVSAFLGQPTRSPEGLYLAWFQSPVSIKVAIPMMPEKSEWKLNGQVLGFTLPLADNVANLKTKIQEELNMPPAKQKLFFDVSFLVF